MALKQLKNKLSKKTPLLMSPFGFALAACGGGGGSSGLLKMDLLQVARRERALIKAR